METNTLFITFAFVCVLIGCVCLFVACIAIAYALATLSDHDKRIAALEALTALKPNQRAAMERRDAYEEALFSVVKAQEEVEIARTRLDALTNILSQKAQGK